MTRVSSIFSQMLQLFSRTEFEQAVREHRAEWHARGFSCWGQFVAVLSKAAPLKNDEVNPVLVTIARYFNTLAKYGVPADHRKFVVVFHGRLGKPNGALYSA